MNKILVFSGDHHQYRALIDILGLNPYEVRYITSREAVIGLRGYTVLRFGTWAERRDAIEIGELISRNASMVLTVTDR